MAGHGFKMARYADDMVVMCRSREEAGKALETIREWMAGVGFTLRPDQTRVVDMSPQGSIFSSLAIGSNAVAGDCVPFCANGGAAKAAAGIIKDGQTATLQDSGSFA